MRYILSEWHEQLVPEFMEELHTRGRIYGYRFRLEGDLKAKPFVKDDIVMYKEIHKTVAFLKRNQFEY